MKARQEVNRKRKAHELDELFISMSKSIRENVDKDKQEEALVSAKKMIEMHKGFIFDNESSPVCFTLICNHMSHCYRHPTQTQTSVSERT